MPNSVVVFVVLHVVAGLQVHRTQSRPHAHSPTAPTTVHSAQFSNGPPRSRPPPSPRSRLRFLHTHFLTKKLRRTRKGSSLRKRRGRPSRGACPAPPRAQSRPGPTSSPRGPSALSPEPWPSDLAVHRDGVGGDDERLLSALGLVLLGLLLGQSRVERHLHHGAAWGALGGGCGLGRGLRAPGYGCSLLGRAPNAAQQQPETSSSAATEVATAAGLLKPRSSQARAATARSAPLPRRRGQRRANREGGTGGGVGGGPGGVEQADPKCRCVGESDPGWKEGSGWEGRGPSACGREFCSSEFVSNQFATEHKVAALEQKQVNFPGCAADNGLTSGSSSPPFPAWCQPGIERPWNLGAFTPPFSHFIMEPAQWSKEMLSSLYPSDLTTLSSRTSPKGVTLLRLAFSSPPSTPPHPRPSPLAPRPSKVSGCPA